MSAVSRRSPLQHGRSGLDASSHSDRISAPCISRIYTTRQGEVVFRSIAELGDGLITYATTQIDRFEDDIKRLTWADLCRLRYVPDEPGRDSWFDVLEILAQGADDCEGLGMLFAIWLFLKFGIEAYPGIAWFASPGTLFRRQKNIVVHCVTLIPDVPHLPAHVRATCWTRYPMYHPIHIPQGWVIGDLSVVNGMVIPAQHADQVGTGPQGRGLPAGVVTTASGLIVPQDGSYKRGIIHE